MKAAAGGEDRLRGILFFCAAMLVFTGLDTAAKYAVLNLPALEVTWARYVGHTAIAILVLQPWRNFADYRTRKPWLQGARALMLFVSTLLNFVALRTLRLDQTTTINFAAAFVMAALAWPLLGEYVGPRRWAAIGAGFIGVLIVIRPGTAAFEPAMVLSVGSMFCYAGYMLLTRHLAATESVGSLLLISGLVPSVLMAPLALPSAVMPPTVLVAAALVATGLCGALGHWMLIRAYALTPAPVVAPFLYTQLVWMIVAGYFAFGQFPDGGTLIGAAIIIASALYILYRQRVHGDR